MTVNHIYHRASNWPSLGVQEQCVLHFPLRALQRFDRSDPRWHEDYPERTDSFSPVGDSLSNDETRTGASRSALLAVGAIKPCRRRYSIC